MIKVKKLFHLVRFPHAKQKKAREALPSSFWRDKRLASVAAFALIALIFVGIEAMPHSKPPPNEKDPVVEPQAKQQTEPFDIMLGGTPSEDVPLIPNKSIKTRKPIVQEAETTEKTPVQKAATTRKAPVQKVATTQKTSVQKAVTTQKTSVQRVATKQKATMQKAVTPAPKKAAVPALKKQAPAVIKPSVEEKINVENDTKEEQAEHQSELAQDFMQKGDVKQAMLFQRRAVELDPANMLYRLNLGIMHDRVADKDGAAMLYRQIIQAYNNHDITLPPKLNIDDVRSRLDYLVSTDPQ